METKGGEQKHASGFELCLTIDFNDLTRRKTARVRTHRLEERPRSCLAQEYKNIEGENLKLCEYRHILLQNHYIYIYQWLHPNQHPQRGSVASTIELCDGACSVGHRAVASIQFGG